jgi:hypothetical protein
MLKRKNGVSKVAKEIYNNVPAILKGQVPDKQKGRLHGIKYIEQARINKEKWTIKHKKDQQMKQQQEQEEEEHSSTFPTNATQQHHDVDPKELKKDQLLAKKLWNISKLKHWKNVPGLPFESYLFHRIVVDEYTYLTGQRSTLSFSLRHGLRSSYRWV